MYSAPVNRRRSRQLGGGGAGPSAAEVAGRLRNPAENSHAFTARAITAAGMIQEASSAHAAPPAASTTSVPILTTEKTVFEIGTSSVRRAPMSAASCRTKIPQVQKLMTKTTAPATPDTAAMSASAQTAHAPTAAATTDMAPRPMA
ncbi:hypothetical protein ACE2AJ_00710 [Aquihabitans daechungensis]|uniref:hypothetical protein n=1 Tax=Aquihabitans daechungensis TaxID=1052257 RepID=UPI003BA36209